MFSLHENLWPGDAPGPPNNTFARHKKAARHGTSPEPPLEPDGERVLRRLEAALNRLPAGIFGSGATQA